MDRTKRATKAIVRLIADPNFGMINPKKEEVVSKPKKQPQKPAEPPRASEKIASKTPSAPTKTKKTERRTLHLDLPENKPSEYEKFIEDWSEPSHPFWKDNFYTPQDNTTQEYKEATDKLLHFLPASFALINNTPETFGVANLELNPDLVKPIKIIPL